MSNYIVGHMEQEDMMAGVVTTRHMVINPQLRLTIEWEAIIIGAGQCTFSHSFRIIVED